MNRSIWFAGCAVFAMLLTPLSAAAQDPFTPIDQPAVQNPFEEKKPADISSAIDRSLIVPGKAQQADAPAPTDDFCQCVGETNSTAVAKIEAALGGQLTSAGLDFNDAPLEEVVAIIQEAYDIPVQLDAPALEEIGIDPQEPVTVNVHGISLRSALRLMLKKLGLTHIIANEVLMITTPEEAESEFITCVYDVRDLVKPLRSEIPMGATASADFDSLVDVITNCITPETWKENGGGAADIRPLKTGLLVISQTRAVHDEVHSLLRTIREMQSKPTAAEPAANDKAAAANTDPNSLITRPYFLSLAQPVPEEVRVQVQQLITSSLPDEQWEGRLANGQPVLLTVLPDRVVLRHRPAVHEKVSSLLVDSAVAAPPVPSRGGGFGGGGGGFGGGSGGGFFRPRPAASQ